MKLNELHVDEFRSGVVGQGMTVSSVFPTVTGDFVRATDSARRYHDCLGTKNFEMAPLTLVSKGSNHTVTVFEQRENRVLHVNIASLMNAMILQGADHLQPGAITDVRQPRIFVAAKMSLQNSAIFGAIENGAP